MKAFKIAQDFLGIPVSSAFPPTFIRVSSNLCSTLVLQQLLDVEDLCDARPPDERSVMTYVAGFFHAFSSMGEPPVIKR